MILREKKRCTKYISAVVDNNKRFAGFIRASSFKELDIKSKQFGVKLYGKIFGYLDEKHNFITSRTKEIKGLRGWDWSSYRDE